jgi:rod shape determining protein RodA
MRWIEVTRSLDWVAACAALLLMGVGLATLLSTSYPVWPLFQSRFGRQIIAIVIGGALYLTLARLPYHAWRQYVPIVYILGIAGLIIVLLTAAAVRGTVSRLSVGGFQIQPSEFMKVATILMLAYFFQHIRRLTWRTHLTSALLVAVPVTLILREPDLGTAVLLGCMWLAVLIFIGLPWWLVGLVAVGGIVASLIAWQWFLVEYQKQRLLIFLYPHRDPLGAGYNITQSIVALGSGGLFGRGLGHGPQSQLKFLPELETDFIFASIGEELGFLGVCLILGLYAVLLWRMLRTARFTRDTFGQIVVVGAASLLISEVAISAGMNMGLLPVTGLPLPLISYGGSSLISTLVLLGLVQSVHVHNKWVQNPPLELNELT